MHDQEPMIVVPPACLPHPFDQTPIAVHPDSEILPDVGYAETYAVEKEHEAGRGDRLKSVLSAVSGAKQKPHHVSQVAYTPLDRRRVLGERQINMVAFAGTVGFGLFLDGGQSVASAGPGGAVLAYIIMGTVMSSVMSCLGEMAALMPVNAPVMEFPRRFLDRGVGFAVGWMYWFAYAVIGSSQLAAVANAVRFQYDDGRTVINWTTGQNVDSSVWITAFLVPTVAVNLLPVRVYGELEYLFGSLKIAFITLLIVLMFVLDQMQPRAEAYYNQPLGTKYWNSPWSFFSHTYKILDDQGNLQGTIQGSIGTFLGVTTTLIKVVFSYTGMDILAATAAESIVLTNAETMRMGARKISIRVTTLYTLAILTASFVVPYDHPYLNGEAPSTGAGSIFVIAVVEAGIPAAAHFLNAFFVFSAATCHIGNIYVSSRVLHTLALRGQTGPEWVTRRLRHCRGGVPTTAVLVSSLLSMIAYIGRSGAPATRVSELANNAAVSYCIVYLIICATYLNFYQTVQRAKHCRRASDVQAACYDRDHELYPYKSHGQWLKAAYGMVACTIVLLFNGVPALLEQPFDVGGFLSAYLGIPVFVLLLLGYKIHRHGLNFREYGFERSDDLSNAVQAASPKRKGRLEFEPGGWTKENVGLFFTWVWDWMK